MIKSSTRLTNAAGPLFLAVFFILSIGAGSISKEKSVPGPRLYRPDYDRIGIGAPGYEPGHDASAVRATTDTYCTVWYDFEELDWQGWIRVDNTAQKGTFFHVDDFAGLGGGTYGRLVPIEGTKSAWCGAGSFSGDYSCSWEAAPGYGNGWAQLFQTDDFTHVGSLTVSFHIVCDTESDMDVVYFEHSDRYAINDSFSVLASFSGLEDTVVTQEIFTSRYRSKLRFHFESDGAMSDEDGLYDTDGACIIDSITIADDEGLIDFEDFEACESGDTTAGIWTAYRGSRGQWEETYGMYSGFAAGLRSRDPCADNFSTVVTFFNGSPYPSADYPGLFDTPFCTGSGGIEKPCQDEMIVSPPIDLARYSSGRDETQDSAIPPGELPLLGGLVLEYALFSDNPLENLVFRSQAVRSVENGCAGEWIGPGLWTPYEPAGWWTPRWEIGDIVTSDTIQVALGVVDMCHEWYGIYGDCVSHTPGPWYDNVRIYRYDTGGPQWKVRRAELFQDAFPQEVEGSADPMEEFCRADMAIDVAPGGEMDLIDPGDSAVVGVSARFAGGLDTLTTGEARVYCHVNATYIGGDPQKPDLFGLQLEGTYGSYVSDDGDWTVLLCGPARTSAGSIAPDKYAIDLNDSLFTRGYMIEYYFEAYSLDGRSGTYPPGAESVPESRFFGSSHLLEFTCLPTLRDVPGILYVDDFDGRGTFEGTVQVYFDNVFHDLITFEDEIPDRYDVNGPSSALSNGIGARVSIQDAASIFCAAYDAVIFDSGDLGHCTVSDGTGYSDKSNDAQLLVDWMYRSEHDVGLLMMGDGIASDLSGSPAAAALELMSTLCGVSLLHGSYFEMTGGVGGGGIVTPLVTGVPGGPLEHASYYAFGGCPGINGFDVLLTTVFGMYALWYPDHGGQQYYGGICTDQLNNSYHALRTVWVGHSFMNIRPEPETYYYHDMWAFFINVFHFFGQGGHWGEYAGGEPPKATSLSQNVPNPFNPATRLPFSLRKKGRVSLRIYDVSGRLVRVLLDEVREAGSHEALWDGLNDGGRAAASGIYFCRMEAGGYERTVKMVLLK